VFKIKILNTLLVMYYKRKIPQRSISNLQCSIIAIPHNEAHYAAGRHMVTFSQGWPHNHSIDAAFKKEWKAYRFLATCFQAASKGVLTKDEIKVIRS